MARGRRGASRYAWGVVCAALACHGAAPDVPVAFTEVTDDRMPTVAQADVLGGDRFWGPGAAAGDVDGDGRVDLYLSGGGLYLNRNDPRGFRFERAPVQPAEPGFDVLGAVFADVDRDGDLDLTLCGAGGVRLLANDGSGAFEDVTQAAGIAVPATDVCVETAWGDLDGDGFPDLSVATYGSPGDRADAEVGHLYLNNRDGTFREATDAIGGPDRARRSLTTAFADFDGDGAVDLYFGDDQFIELESGQPRGDLVFLNRGLDDQGRLQLEEASETLGLDGFRATMGCAFGDPARTGGWDLLFSDVFRIWIYHRSPGGSAFEDVTLARGDDLRGPPEEKWVMWGGQFADFDGDGYEDALVAQAPVLFGERNQERLGPVLLRNRGGTFERVRYAFGGPLLARGTLLADLDGDGDDDVVTAPLFGPFRAFVNDTAPRDAVRVRLVGTVSEPGAAGAVVVATAGSVAQQRMVVAGCRPFAEGPPVVDIALAGATSMDLQIAWPSGARQRVDAVPAGAQVTIVEPRWLVLDPPSPAADGRTTVSVAVDLTALGRGGPGSRVQWSSPHGGVAADADGAGKATLVLPPQARPVVVRGRLSVDGEPLFARPAVSYRSTPDAVRPISVGDD